MNPQTRRRVTATDVAREVGVSRTTVSYVLNNRPHQSIPEATRQRVVDAASRLGYVASPAARALATGRSRVVIALLGSWPAGDNQGQFFRRMTAAFAEHGYVFLTHTDEHNSGTSVLWRELAPAAVLTLGEGQMVDRDLLAASGVDQVVALLGGEAPESALLYEVERRAGAAQAEHLHAGGHQRLGYAWPDDDRLQVFAQPRWDGVRAACSRLGLDEPLLERVGTDPHSATGVLARWRDRGVSGICCYNDEVAGAVVASARELGWHCPDQVAVIGFDDTPAATHLDPPLTSLNTDRTTVAGAIAAWVARQLDGQPPGELVVDNPISVVVRSTT